MANNLNLVVDGLNFQALAMRTNSNTTGTHNEVTDTLVRVATPDLVHAALGINDEFFELADAVESGDEVNIIEEQGDLLWFLALASHSLGFNLLTTDHIKDSPGQESVDVAGLLRKSVADITSYVKKAYAYGKMDNGGLLHIQNGILQAVRCVNTLSVRMGKDPLEVRQKVIDKLVKRFGDKYSDVAADINNRDLDGEREVLAGDA